jgi:putative two-component system protein, hydrogenase maturation factor HypX/HoxX
MRILLVASAYNGLCQRAHIELALRGHEVSVELFIDEEAVREGIALFKPDLVICPFLKQHIPDDICKHHTCIIIHPGIKGDRGPSSLDWAILDGVEEWGVTAVQAAPDWDAGDIWATAQFRMRETPKASLYRHEMTEASLKVIFETIARFEQGDFKPEPLDYSRADVKGAWRPAVRQVDRRIDWRSDTTDTVLRKIHSADSSPGVLDTLYGQEYYLYGAHREGELRGPPAAIIAQRCGAICRATVDGAVWISHLKPKTNDGSYTCKLPATRVLGDALTGVPESPLDLLYRNIEATFQEIRYEEHNDVGYLYFDFYNGAMGTEQCYRLRDAVLAARARNTKVLVLESGLEFWSNGFHLNLIEAADDSSLEAWQNINAIDDLVLAILTTNTKLVIAAVGGNAAAGGVPLALAADIVYAREGIVLNPHYQTMGLYGSEYWTYLLPRRIGQDKTRELIKGCRAMGVREAQTLGLINGVIQGERFHQQIVQIAEALARGPRYQHHLAFKRKRREEDEQIKPLARYRAEELQRMKTNFYGQDHGFHTARFNFVYKVPPLSTPLRLAEHRQRDDELRAAWAI